jgi:hypothetical protein
MTWRITRWVVLLAALAVVGTVGWNVATVLAEAGQMDAEMQQKMKQMMMNRPKAMKKADKAIQDLKSKLSGEGKYTCCLKHPCDSCALKMAGCPCGMNAMDDKPVCNECKGGWYAGDGAVPDKTPDQIKTMPRGGMDM